MIAVDCLIDAWTGFDDPRCDAPTWNAILAEGDTNAVFLTWQWQKAWWDSFDRSGLMLLAARRNGKLVAIAPFFSEAGMIYFVGSGGSDYLDFIGDLGDAAVVEGLLMAAKSLVQDFVGFQLFHIPNRSRTAHYLSAAASRLGLVLREEGNQIAPAAELAPDPGAALALTRKKSLLRHEAQFRKTGPLAIAHHSSQADIEPHLDAFFQQHIDRWNGTGHPSLFLDERQRCFYRNLTRYASDAGWLRFTQVEAANRSIAFHYGFAYGHSFLWYKPSFAIDLARQSPGEVLLRQLLLRAIEEGAETFDFGLGDEPFKARFATTHQRVHNWGLYPANKPLPEVWL